MKPEIYDPTNLPLSVCEHLFDKTRVCNDQDRDPENWFPGDEMRQTFYWCCLTQDAQGPDGEIVGPEFCQAPRSCCEARRVPRPEA